VGTLVGALLGILILTVLNNGLVLLNVSSFYHDIARGIVIIMAVYLDTRRRRSLSRRPGG
jgi:ribose/xylose/arabinose/galactoside ABC-type transport system permease subunit